MCAHELCVQLIFWKRLPTQIEGLRSRPQDTFALQRGDESVGHLCKLGCCCVQLLDLVQEKGQCGTRGFEFEVSKLLFLTDVAAEIARHLLHCTLRNNAQLLDLVLQFLHAGFRKACPTALCCFARERVAGVWHDVGIATQQRST